MDKARIERAFGVQLRRERGLTDFPRGGGIVPPFVWLVVHPRTTSLDRVVGRTLAEVLDTLSTEAQQANACRVAERTGGPQGWSCDSCGRHVCSLCMDHECKCEEG